MFDSPMGGPPGQGSVCPHGKMGACKQCRNQGGY